MLLIRDILVWIRIRGSIPLTKGTGFGSTPDLDPTLDLDQTLDLDPTMYLDPTPDLDPIPDPDPAIFVSDPQGGNEK